MALGRLQSIGKGFINIWDGVGRHPCALEASLAAVLMRLHTSTKQKCQAPFWHSCGVSPPTPAFNHRFRFTVACSRLKSSVSFTKRQRGTLHMFSASEIRVASGSPNASAIAFAVSKFGLLFSRSNNPMYV